MKSGALWPLFERFDRSRSGDKDWGFNHRYPLHDLTPLRMSKVEFDYFMSCGLIARSEPESRPTLTDVQRHYSQMVANFLKSKEAETCAKTNLVQLQRQHDETAVELARLRRKAAKLNHKLGSALHCRTTRNAKLTSERELVQTLISRTQGILVELTRLKTAVSIEKEAVDAHREGWRQADAEIGRLASLYVFDDGQVVRLTGLGTFFRELASRPYSEPHGYPDCDFDVYAHYATLFRLPSLSGSGTHLKGIEAIIAIVMRLGMRNVDEALRILTSTAGVSDEIIWREFQPELSMHRLPLLLNAQRRCFRRAQHHRLVSLRQHGVILDAAQTAVGWGAKGRSISAAHAAVVAVVAR